MESWGPATFAFVAFALALGGLTKGFAGIGLPLMAVAIMSIAIDPQAAVAVMPMPILITNMWQAFGRHLIGSLCRFWPMLLSLPVGTVFGVKVLTSADPRILSGFLGGIVVLFSILAHRQPGWRLSPRHERLLNPVVGLAAGMIGGISSFFAPPLVMFLAALRLPKDEFVGAIGVSFLVGVVPMILALAAYGVLGPREFVWSTLAAIPVFAGLILGERVRGLISDILFRRLLLVLLLLSGMNLIRQAVG